jgi:hypothetical protein
MPDTHLSHSVGRPKTDDVLPGAHPLQKLTLFAPSTLLKKPCGQNKQMLSEVAPAPVLPYLPTGHCVHSAALLAEL